MALIYKFKKEKLEKGTTVLRPRIYVLLNGKVAQIETPALVDSGADITVIPEGIAKAIGLKMDGAKSRLYGHRESSEVVHSEAEITFLSRAGRENVSLKIPVLIVMKKENLEEESDIVLGVEGVFDAFDITFKKASNRIILKKVQ